MTLFEIRKKNGKLLRIAMEMPIRSLHEHIAARADKNAKKTALRSCDQEGNIVQEISYGELAKKIEQAAAYLESLGLKKGDRVSIALGNSAELLILSWAAWASGIVTVPMDTKRDTGELYRYKMKLNGVRVLIAQPDALKKIDSSFLSDARVEEFSGFHPSREDTSHARSHLAEVKWESGLDHPALILFTSGTTGHPKGAKLSLKNLIVNADSIRQWLQIKESDTFLVNLPLHHINSTTFCLSVLLAGGTIAIPPMYSNSHFWQQMAKTGATITSIVQSILFDQLSREKEYRAVKDKVKLNRIQIGSAPVIAHSVTQFREKYGIPLYQGYGQTETALRVTGVPMGLPDTLYRELVETNSIGAAMPWADLQISDEQGVFLSENQEGELVVKGEANMAGYVGNEPAFRDHYFLTGDVGYYTVIDGRKYYFLKGRKREIIIKGGINISPAAVENHLRKISDDIDQVYAVGVADERYGEEVAAVVCWKPGIDAAAAMLRLKYTLIVGTSHLSAYETPKYLTPYKLEDLPSTSTGKVQRTLLRDRVPPEQFESLYDLIRTPRYTFSLLHPLSPHVAASHELYNYCWRPMVVDAEAYKKSIARQFIVLAIDAGGRLAGQIAFVRTDLPSSELLRTAYRILLRPHVSNNQGSAAVCISICGADYKLREIPTVTKIPDTDAVRAYIPQDPVFKFHQKPKGGQEKGAELIDVIPAGRPEDKSSLGYNMLLKYPPVQNASITGDAPVSNQLIEAVMVIAQAVGIKDIYAYSRPGGLASFIATSKLSKNKV